MKKINKCKAPPKEELIKLSKTLTIHGMAVRCGVDCETMLLWLCFYGLNLVIDNKHWSSFEDWVLNGEV